MQMKTLVAVATGLVLSGCCAFKSCNDGCCRYPETVNEGFVSLFNGVDLEGWEGATAMYGVDPKEPGVLQCFPERKLPAGQRSDLFPDRRHPFFDLHDTHYFMTFPFVSPLPFTMMKS